MFTNFTFSNIVIVLVCLLISMTIHEFMHAYVGLKLGDTTAMVRGRVSFNPLHHIDRGVADLRALRFSACLRLSS